MWEKRDSDENVPYCLWIKEKNECLSHKHKQKHKYIHACNLNESMSAAAGCICFTFDWDMGRLKAKL